MEESTRQGLRWFAEECVALVATSFDRALDWSLDSLTTVDEVCHELLADGPLAEERLDLWWKLVGAYTGEVVIAAYGGAWVEHERAGGAYAIAASGVTGFPFATAQRVLQGEMGKSLASFGRMLPVIRDETARRREG